MARATENVPLMRRHANAFALAGSIIAASLGGSLSQAQGTMPLAPPEQDSVAFDDWALNCQNVGTPAKTVKQCEIIQSIVVEGQKEPIARIAIGRLSADQPWHVTLMLPTNIALPSNVLLKAGAKAQPLELHWTRCIPGACFAEAQLDVRSLAQWRTITDVGQISFTDAGRRAISFPMSFKGFAVALDALMDRPVY